MTFWMHSYTVADPADEPQTASTLIYTVAVTGTFTASAPASTSSSASLGTPSSTSRSTSKPANVTLVIIICAVAGGVILIVLVLIYLRWRRRLKELVPIIEIYKARRLNQNEGSIEIRPLIPSTGSSKNGRNQAGFFMGADRTDANHGQFSDVQGNQTINTVNYYSWPRRDVSVMQSSPLQ